MGFLERKAKELKRKVRALYLCFQDPEVPRFVKILALLIVAYAVSPIDLIPDWIPVLGYLDDLLIIPLGVALVIHLIPHRIYDAHYESAAEWEVDPRFKKIGMILTLGVWALVGIIVLSTLIHI
jgi:uncharacterized membrane protein YkvA (DUF1232 family)